MTDTINIPRAELQAALDALQECRQKIAYLLGNIEWYESAQAIDFADISIKAIRARLAQPEKEQEPVAKVRIHKTGGNAGISWSAAPVNDFDSLPLLQDGALLYTATPQREWKSLTEEEIWNADEIMAANSECGASFETLRELVHAISDKLKEKNA